MEPRIPKGELLWPWVRYFLEVHLPNHLGLSSHTQASYRIAFRLFRCYLDTRKPGSKAARFRLSDLEVTLMLDFLSWLEDPRGRNVSPQTRNARLAAWRAFFRFLRLHRSEGERCLWERFQMLPFKRTTHTVTDHLEFHEVERVLGAVDLNRRDGFRDLTLLAFLYNTGARAQEVALMRKSGLILDYPPTVRLLGKGRRERVCPLWPSTAVLLERYLADHRPQPLCEAEPFVFVNQRRGVLTRHGVRRIIKKHVKSAAETLPSLRRKNLTPHSFRHSTAVHLLESGADINVLKAWLGHRSVKSTGRYLDLTLENHRQMLESLPLPARLRAWEEPDLSAAETTDAVKAWLEEL